MDKPFALLVLSQSITERYIKFSIRVMFRNFKLQIANSVAALIATAGLGVRLSQMWLACPSTSCIRRVLSKVHVHSTLLESVFVTLTIPGALFPLGPPKARKLLVVLAKPNGLRCQGLPRIAKG